MRIPVYETHKYCSQITEDMIWSALTLIHETNFADNS